VRRLFATEPVKIKCKTNQTFPAVPQYPFAWEAEDGICPVILSLKKQGVLIPARSLCNTRISSVKKEGKFHEQGRQIWRFVQDLWKINSFVIPSHIVVPNPVTIPTSIPDRGYSFCCYWPMICHLLCLRIPQFTVFVCLYLPGTTVHLDQTSSSILWISYSFLSVLKTRLRFCYIPKCLNLGTVCGWSSGSFLIFGSLPREHTPSTVCLGQ